MTYMCLDQALENFSVKDPIEIFLSFTSQAVSVSMLTSVIVEQNQSQTNEHGCVPIKLYLQREVVNWIWPIGRW